jgi:DTW domain-containing protein YfiP
VPTGSNTGCLCGASLAGCRLLLHGHAPHDAALAALLADDSVTTALLWPGPDALEPSALADLAAQRSGGRIALVAIDATWDGAARMRRRYPPGG